jgi:putative NADH-flavin reductase
MNIVIFGANGPTGRLLTQQAIDKGYTVTAFTRHPETFPIQDARLRVLSGDVYDLAAVEQAVAGQDAVFSALGGVFGGKEVTVYSLGTGNIVQAMKDNDVRRLICITSSALEPHETGGGFFFDNIMSPLVVNVFGKTLYADMRKMEELVMRSNLDWTIVRPSGLFETPAVTDYQEGEGHLKGTYTSRADLAASMLHQLTTDQYRRKAVAVITTAMQPKLFDFFVKEALKR